MNLAMYKRRLMISAALAAVLVACAWYYDAMVIAMLCVLAVMVQLVRLLYNLLKWNRAGLAAGAIRLAVWVAATAGTLTAHNHYATLTRTRGDALVAALQAYRAREGRYPAQLEALVPRDIAAIPAVALLPSREQKFRYRLVENDFRLVYFAGFRLGAEYDSQSGKWTEFD